MLNIFSVDRFVVCATSSDFLFCEEIRQFSHLRRLILILYSSSINHWISGTCSSVWQLWVLITSLQVFLEELSPTQVSSYFVLRTAAWKKNIIGNFNDHFWVRLSCEMSEIIELNLHREWIGSKTLKATWVCLSVVNEPLLCLCARSLCCLCSGDSQLWFKGFTPSVNKWEEGDDRQNGQTKDAEHNKD